MREKRDKVTSTTDIPQGYTKVGDRIARLAPYQGLPPGALLYRAGAWHCLGLRLGLTKEDVWPPEVCARIDREGVQEDNPEGYGRVTWYHFARDINGQPWAEEERGSCCRPDREGR